MLKIPHNYFCKAGGADATSPEFGIYKKKIQKSLQKL